MLLGFLWLQTIALAQNEQVLKGPDCRQQRCSIAGAVVNVAEQVVLPCQTKMVILFKNVKSQDEICVSSVGYLNATANADFNEGFQIVLAEDLDEYLHTMPVPFGRKKKKLMTEATSVVTGQNYKSTLLPFCKMHFTATVNGMTYEWSSEAGVE